VKSARCFLFSILTWLAAGAAALCQDDGPPGHITLYPQDAPRPPLKYRLLPGVADQIEGNAAVYYGKVRAEQNRFFNDAGLQQKIENWQDAPLAELRDEAVAITLPDYFLEQGALCKHCDWQFPVGREPVFGILLPEVQGSRQYGRILSAKARINIARGDFDAAVKHLRLAYALARHVAEGEFLVSKLVGVAVSNLASLQTLEFIQQPGAPNLYWSLSALPRPMFDFRNAVNVEADAWALSFPELREPAKIDRTSEQWRATLVALWKNIAETTDDDAYKRPPEEMADRCLDKIAASFDRLVNAGWKKDQLMALPAEQVVTLDLLMTYKVFADEAATAFFLPYPEASRELKAIQLRVKAFREDAEECAALPLIMIQPLIDCRAALTRSEHNFAVLRTLEALRLYAARHGALPAQLSDVTDVVVPNDPATEQPFRYSLDGDVARISSSPQLKIRLGTSDAE
jgi:hypothetical protein